MRTRVPVLSLLAALSLLGCTLNTDYFGEYRGVNLLGNYDFDATDGGTPKWGTTTLGLDPAFPAADPFMRWHRIGASAVVSDNVADASAGTPTVGPDGVSPAFRLEVRNLVPNGDFESSTTPEGGNVAESWWSLTDIGGTSMGSPGVTFTSTPTTITDRGMIWVSTQNGDQLRLDLRNTVFPVGASPPAFWFASGYRFRLDLINNKDTGQVGISLLGSDSGAGTNNLFQSRSDWTVPTQNPDLSSNTTDVFSASESFFFPAQTLPTDPIPDRIVAFGALRATDTPPDVMIDNLRLLPDRDSLSVKASLTSLSSGTLQLLPGSKDGMYNLIVSIMDDPLAGSNNRFFAKVFSMKVNIREKGGTRRLPPMTFIRPATGWSSWTTVTFPFGADFVDRDSDLGGTPALEVFFSPTYLSPLPASGVDVGTILISRPVLTFNP